MPQHDVIDNRNTLLVNRVKDFLPHSTAAHFATGYFFLSGFKAIADDIQHLEKLRLLIGNTSNRETIEQMVEGYSRLKEGQHRKRSERMNAGERDTILDETRRSAGDVLELMVQSDEEQQAALSLARGIAEGRVEVRVYTKGRLHAKAYIFDFNDDMPYDGAGIVGSSNFTISGLSHNTELNASLDGNGNHGELLDWFDELWDESEEFSADLMEAIAQSWVANDKVTPYDIYMRTLYTLVKERLVEASDTKLLWEAEMPPLAAYQEVAVQQTRHILKEYGGVFVADVVGLGKSFIGLSLLKHWNIYEGAYGIVICPASLVAMWEMYIAKFRIWATVLSSGMLSQKGNERLLLDDPKYSNAGIVLIDESHNFRNRDSRRYQALELFTADRPTILMTATPRNTSAWDIYHQTKLWHPDDRTTLLDPPNPPNLAEFFRKVEPRNGDRPTASIRDMLDKILIRRTRRHVLNVYGEEDQNGRKFVSIQDQPKYFPDRQLETISYNIESTYGAQVYATLRELMGDLQYARYNLFPYVSPDYHNHGKYKNLQKASGSLRGLMRVMMFKRFESSIAAFRATVKRLITIHEWFLQSIDAGIIPAGEEAQSILYNIDKKKQSDDHDDQVEFADLEQELRQASQDYHIDHFETQALYDAINDDLQILRKMERLIEPITPKLDDKLIVLQEMLKKGRNPHEDNRQLPGTLPTNKVLIFTQFSDTADYLYENIKQIIGDKLIRKVDSNTTDLLEVISRFAPKANPSIKTVGGDLRVLVATDVLSEGLNLQDGDHIINYDLHWNPVRLIQRVGRVDRLGSEHDCVFVYNFLPEAGVERQLGLQERLTHRIQEIHDMIGEDAFILSRSERLNDEAMYAIYNKDSDILDDESEDDIPFSLLEAEEIIRQIQQDDPEYFKYIEQLPNGLRSSLATDRHSGAYVLCEAQDHRGDAKYRRMYLVDENGSIHSSDLQNILRVLRCDPDTGRAAIPSDFNSIVSKIQDDFEQEVVARQSELQHSSGRSGLGRGYIVEQLQLIHDHAKDDNLRRAASYLSQLFASRSLPRRCHNELNSLRNNNVKNSQLIEQLKRIARDYGLESTQENIQKRGNELVARIICSEALR
jgi:superfamily II DNA or RNA helicase